MELETKRLLLREVRREDYHDLCAFLQDIEVMYAWEHGFSAQEVQGWLDECLMRYERDGYSYCAVIEKTENRLIGVCGLIQEKADGEAYLGLGYIFNRAYWHCGYAYESAAAWLDYGFQQLGAAEITAQVRPENTASARLAEKLGMTVKKEFVKVYRGKEMPHLLYSRLA